MATEKRLIDANALKERAIRVSTVKEHCYMKAVGTHEIDKAPTVDAVEVVRCKNCKYVRNMAPIGESGYEFGECIMRETDDIEFAVYDDDFCSYGERSADEN